MKRKIVQILFLILSVLGLVTQSYGLFILFLGSSLLFGAFFCGWLCPFGFIQDLIDKFGRFLKIPQFNVPQNADRFLKFFRYIIFILIYIGIGVAILLDSPLRVFNSILSLNLTFISVGSWVIFGILLSLNLFITRPYCRYFCSDGARYGAVSLLRIFSIKRDKQTCINCKKCDKSCPMGVIVSVPGHVREPGCNNCFECIKACPVNGCLSYKLVIKKDKEII